MKKILSVLILLSMCAAITGCSKLGGGTVSNIDTSQAMTETESSEPEMPDPLRFPEGYVPDLNSWELKLVDENNSITDDYAITLASIEKYSKPGMQVDERIIDATNAMLQAAADAGLELYVTSSYRTVSYQKGIFDANVNLLMEKGMSESEAIAETRRNIAVPGKSEHNLGLALDIVTSTWYMTNDDVNESFADTPHFKWLEENAAQYGFVISYLQGKQALTYYNYEPWHYRYVGVEAAKIISDLGICLQEFYMIANGENVYPTNTEIKTTADMSSATSTGEASSE